MFRSKVLMLVESYDFSPRGVQNKCPPKFVPRPVMPTGTLYAVGWLVGLSVELQPRTHVFNRVVG